MVAVLGASLGAAPGQAAGPAHVAVAQRADGYVLLRDGEPFFIRGSGGEEDLEALRDAGANTLRTWGISADTGALLDRAEALGLAVTLGIWLGHPRHGFDYGDPAQVAAQLARARAEVLRYKDHPALLLWGVGNETEGFADGDDPAVWAAVNDVAAMIHEVDPHHPTMVVTAEIGGARVARINALCPAVDIHGINSYGGLPSVPARYRAAGGTKPYVVTEFGPPGTWEVGRTAWGAPLELTSTQKAAAYRDGWVRGVRGAPGLCLGGFAFHWGAKEEATATWYGMLLPDGSKLAAVDAMTELWSGSPPANRCPTLAPIAVAPAAVVSPGGRVEARVEAADPDGDPVALSWELRSEPASESIGGDATPPIRDWPGAVVADPDPARVGHAAVQLPRGGGAYRLYAYARDGRGGAAVANIPLRVDGPELPAPAYPARLPLALYGDDVKRPPFAASGWMGAVADVKMDPASRERPARGATCVRVDFLASAGWAGVVWQDPANDWGDVAGGYDLRGAQTLSVWARGAKGGEQVTFVMGLIGPDKAFPDSAKAELAVTLSFRWQQYFIDLRGLDLSRVKTGFGWVVVGRGDPLTFFLDDIRYE